MRFQACFWFHVTNGRPKMADTVIIDWCTQRWQVKAGFDKSTDIKCNFILTRINFQNIRKKIDYNEQQESFENNLEIVAMSILYVIYQPLWVTVPPWFRVDNISNLWRWLIASVDLKVPALKPIRVKLDRQASSIPGTKCSGIKGSHGTTK